MPAEIKWFIAEHVIYMKLYGDVSVEDVLEVSPKAIEMIESVATPFVHTIADMREVSTFPRQLGEYRKIYSKKAHNSGWVIIIGDNKLIQFFSSIASNYMKLRVTYLNNIEEALKFLSLRDIAISTDKIAEVLD